MIYKYFIVTTASLLLSFILTPAIIKFSFRHRWFDKPNNRKVHPNPVPTIGGIGIYLPIVFSMFLVGLVDKFEFITIESLLGFILGGTVVSLLGIYDDIKTCPIFLKILLQILSGIILYAFGYRVTTLANPFNSLIHLGVLSFPITIIWVVLFVNAINLIDGLDGLAAGISCIVAFTFFFTSLNTGEVAASLFALSILGGCAGFLRYNFFPAKIFMGDTGSMFLGFALAGTALQGAGKSVAVITTLVPLLALGVPLTDVILTVFRRKRRGKSIFEADKEHLHHKLLDIGFTHRESVFILYIATALLGMVAIALSTADRGVITIFVLLSIMSFFILGAIIKRR